jgi:terminase, large subunit
VSHNLPAETRLAIAAAVRQGLLPLRAETPQNLSTWAAKHFELDEESSHQSGRWTPWPFQVGWMNAFSNDAIEEVNVQKAKRVGYTKTVVAFIAYNAAHRRRKQAVWQPTDADRDSFEKSEVSPALQLCKPVAAVRRAGASLDTLSYKRFRGSALHLLGATAARNFRRITTAVSILDEVDAMDQVVEKTIDPVTGARGRLEGAPFPKLVLGTTPRIKGVSHIERRTAMAGARMLYHIACPSCDVEHPLLWGGKDVPHGMKWDGSDPKTSPATVRHVCPHCRAEIRQVDYLRVWDEGAWVDAEGRYRYEHRTDEWRDARNEPCLPPTHVAFDEAWAAYSPQRAWGDIVREFLEARIAQKAGDNGPMQGFANETLARTWEESYERQDETELQRRARLERDKLPPLRTVPVGACKVLMGIDTQNDRWEATTWAVGRGEEMWPIDHQVIYGTPADEREWKTKLAPVVTTVYTHVNGMQMPLDGIAIDTAGTNWTHQAYNFVRERPHLPLYAVRGEGVLGSPIKMKPSLVDVNARGKVVRRGVKLWRVCTDTAKDLLHGRLSVTQPGPGYVHLHADLPPEWFAQLVAEQRVPVRTSRGREFRWVLPSGRRNEVLDCTVYVLFLIQALNLHAQTAATWRRWEEALVPDLFSTPVDAEPAEAAIPVVVDVVQPTPRPPKAPRRPPPAASYMNAALAQRRAG